MPTINLIQNSDFSEEFSYWLITGIEQNSATIMEGERIFARFGPGVMMYQDVAVMKNTDYIFSFEYRAQWSGNGVTIRIQGLDAGNNPVQLFERAFSETPNWTSTAVSVNSDRFTSLRLLFDIFSAADIDNVQLIPK